MTTVRNRIAERFARAVCGGQRHWHVLARQGGKVGPWVSIAQAATRAEAGELHAIAACSGEFATKVVCVKLEGLASILQQLNGGR